MSLGQVDELEQVVVQRDIAQGECRSSSFRRRVETAAADVQIALRDADLTCFSCVMQEELEYCRFGLRQGEVLRDGAKLQEKSALLLSQAAE